jgi:hypothetical protein
MGGPFSCGYSTSNTRLLAVGAGAGELACAVAVGAGASGARRARCVRGAAVAGGPALAEADAVGTGSGISPLAEDDSLDVGAVGTAVVDAGMGGTVLGIAAPNGAGMLVGCVL